MADDLEQRRREEHWQELAALLGIEPGAPAPKRLDPEPVREERAQERPAPQAHREPDPKPFEPKPRELAPRLFEEVETPHAETGAEIVDAPMDRDEPQNPDQPSSEGEDGRGRRGGRRRRGRGRGGDRKDESRHKPYQRQRDEAPPAAEPAPGFDRPVAEPEEEDSQLEKRHIRSRPAQDRFAADEPAEEAGDELLDQPIPVDDDDEIDEEDAPADWNVITWSELIASLKRFDR